MRVLLLIPLLSMGCRNDCQELCMEISSLAEDCGHEWSDEDEKTCLSDYRNNNTTREYRETCGENLSFVKEEWNCADIDLYFEEEGSSGDGGSDTGS
jgi:hypothetical protein